MYKNGFLKVAAITTKMEIGNISYNANSVLEALSKYEAGILLFPELTLTGYTASDLFYHPAFIEEVKDGLKRILDNNKNEGIVAIGMPLSVNDVLFNVAVVIKKDKILGIIPKYHQPHTGEFYEKRWFQSGYNARFDEVTLFGQTVPFGKMIFVDEDKNIKIGVEVCEDGWANISPSDDLVLAGANIILNLSASTELVGKRETRRVLIKDHSRKQVGAYVYTTTGSFESVAEAIFSNHKMIASLGKILVESYMPNQKTHAIIGDINIPEIVFARHQSNHFKEQEKAEHNYKIVPISIKEEDNYEFSGEIDQLPFVGGLDDIEEAFYLQVAALKQKLLTLPKSLRKLVVGISGGLDSTLALLVAYQAFIELEYDLIDIIAVTMPAKVTTKDSFRLANELMDKLGVKKLTIPINESVEQHLKDINHESDDDTVYENAQARIRTLILMDLANKENGIVLGTGDLSEIALGWMTYNGDQMSMYNVNLGIPKTVIPYILSYYGMMHKKLSVTLEEINNLPISPELKMDQNTEDEVGKYEINDFILYHYLNSGLSEKQIVWFVEKAFDLSNKESHLYVERFFNRFFNSQFKRQVMPEGPKIFDINLSARGHYKLPSDIKKKVIL